MLTIDFADFTKKSLKPIMAVFTKAGLPVKDVEADNKPKREAGYQVKQATLSFESGQTLVLKAKAGGSLYQAKLNGKLLAIKDYIKPDTFIDECVKYVKENEANYTKQKAKQLERVKVLVPKPKPVNTTVAEQTQAFQATLDELKGQNESIQGEIAVLAPVVTEKQVTLDGITSQIAAEHARTVELEKQLDALKSGVMESASPEQRGVRPIEVDEDEINENGVIKLGDRVSLKDGREAEVTGKNGKKVKVVILESATIPLDRDQIAKEMMHGSGRHPAMTAAFNEAFSNSVDINDAILFVNSFSEEELDQYLRAEENILEAAKNKSPIPSLTGWDTFAGGTGAAEGKNSYSIRIGGGDTGLANNAMFSIDPISNNSGRHQGYSLKSFGIPSHVAWRWIGPNGKGSANGSAGLFSKPQEAVKIAQQVYAEAMGTVMECAESDNMPGYTGLSTAIATTYAERVANPVGNGENQIVVYDNGEAIPAVTQETSQGAATVDRPTNCPACGSDLLPGRNECPRCHMVMEGIGLEIDRSGTHDINDPLHVDDPERENGVPHKPCPWCGGSVQENQCINCNRKYDMATQDRKAWIAANKELPADDFPEQYE